MLQKLSLTVAVSTLIKSRSALLTAKDFRRFVYSVLVVGRPFADLQGRGVERYTQNLVKDLADAGFAVDYLGDDPVVKTISRTISPYGSLWSPIVYDFLAPTKTLLRNASHYDIAHLSNVTSGMIAPLLRSRARYVVVTCHDLYGLATEGMVEERRSLRGRLYLNFFERAVRSTFARAERILADSVQTAEEISRFSGETKKIVVVNPSISKSFRRKADVFTKLNKGYVSLGYVGAFTPSRRLDKALRVVQLLRRRITNLKFTVVGTGPLWESLHSLSHKLGIDDIVQFRGFVPENQLVNLYNEFDVLLHPVLYEGFGYTILEAQACGAPVVLFKDARISPEVAKFAVRALDEEEAASIIESIVMTPSRYQAISEQSLIYASSFTHEKMIWEIRKVYEDLMAG